MAAHHTAGCHITHKKFATINFAPCFCIALKQLAACDNTSLNIRHVQFAALDITVPVNFTHSYTHSPTTTPNMQENTKNKSISRTADVSKPDQASITN